MTKPVDDLEAIRLVIQALEPFDSKDRERIIRWAAEKLGMASVPALTVPAAPATPTALAIPHHMAGAPTAGGSSTAKDIRSFVAAKQPKSDNQMAAVVAYFYHFEAPPAERKDSIGKEELLDACRKSESRKRPARPEQVLVNTYHAGLFDKAGSPGQYKLNSVGENLVAMVLPEQDSSADRPPRKAKGSVRKQGARKTTTRHSTTPKSK